MSLLQGLLSFYFLITVRTQTATVLNNFILAMTLYPEVQSRAHEELDRVIGGRLPTAADLGSLPFLDAILKESIRWPPVFPSGKPVGPAARRF